MQSVPMKTTPKRENSHSCGPKWLTACITVRMICDTFRDPRDDMAMNKRPDKAYLTEGSGIIAGLWPLDERRFELAPSLPYTPVMAFFPALPLPCAVESSIGRL
jgi:hypothetical protein